MTRAWRVSVRCDVKLEPITLPSRDLGTSLYGQRLPVGRRGLTLYWICRFDLCQLSHRELPRSLPDRDIDGLVQDQGNLPVAIVPV